MSAPLIIFLHGVGSQGRDLAPLGHFWAGRLPTARFAAPDAPLTFDHGGDGHQWFSVTGITPENRPARLAAARPAFDALLAGVIAEAGLSGRLDQVALVGFSQGAIMALDALASGRWPVKAVVACAGRLASPLPLTPAPFTPETAPQVLLLHGDADPVMPVQESQLAELALRAVGLPVIRHVLPGLGHGISPQAAVLAGDFLAGCFPPSGG